MNLPYDDINQVKVYANEYINNTTINRGNARLHVRDDTLLTYVNALSGILNALISGGIISGDINLNVNGNLQDLDDVINNLNQNVTVGQSINWDGSKWINQDDPKRIETLQDVSLFDPTTGESLVLTSSGFWTNGMQEGIGNIKSYIATGDTLFILPPIQTGKEQVHLVKDGSSTIMKITHFPTDKMMGLTGDFISQSSAEDYSVLTLKAVTGDSFNNWLMYNGVGTFTYESSGITSADYSGLTQILLNEIDMYLAPFNIDIDELLNALIGIAQIGEANVGQNIGTSGENLYLGKNGLNLLFSKLNGSGEISVTRNVDNSIDISNNRTNVYVSGATMVSLPEITDDPQCIRIIARSLSGDCFIKPYGTNTIMNETSGLYSSDNDEVNKVVELMSVSYNTGTTGISNNDWIMLGGVNTWSHIETINIPSGLTQIVL